MIYNHRTCVHHLSDQNEKIISGQQALLLQSAAAHDHLMREIEGSRSMKASMAGLLGQRCDISLQSYSNNPPFSAGGAPRPAGSVGVHNLASQTEPGSFFIQKSQTTNACRTYCGCRCHQLWRVKVPRTFEYISGRLSMSVKGFSLGRTNCDIVSCKSSIAVYAELRYILPAWIAERMIYLRFTSSPTHAPELLIRVPRLVSRDNEGYTAVQSGNLKELKLAIESGACTPYDVDARGESLFNVGSMIW